MALPAWVCGEYRRSPLVAPKAGCGLARDRDTPQSRCSFPAGALMYASTLLLAAALNAAPADADLAAALAALEPKVVAWRRDIHQHPELGAQEVRTAGIVAAHLRELGFEVRTGIAATGVSGVLKGGRPGPKIALRADMDALPVTEETGLRFAS